MQFVDENGEENYEYENENEEEQEEVNEERDTFINDGPFASNELNNFDKPIKNIKFLAIDVINIFKYFPKKYIDKIFLNFSDPWPKKRHAKRRLTSNTYLDI